jgi:hypothetical protein
VTSFETEPSSGDYSEPSELLSPEESLDDDELGIDPDEGYSPAERPWGLSAWGTTAREAASYEDLGHRLAREVPELGDVIYGDGIGDSADTDGEPIDDQVGDMRAGRLVIADIDGPDPGSDYRAHDVGIDGAGASAEEAAVHIVSDDDLNTPDDYNLVPEDEDTRPPRLEQRTVDVSRGDVMDMDAADNRADRSTGTLDDLAAFLMHRAYGPDVTQAERLETFAVVNAYQEGEEPSTIESAMRTMALRFRDHPDYRPEWRPRPGSPT